MSRHDVSRPGVFAGLLSRAWAKGRRKGSIARPRVRPALEFLEDRLVPAVIDVTTLADGTGPGTLRSAVAQADMNAANGDATNTINLTVAGTYNVGQLGALQIFANATAGQSGLSLTIQNTSGGQVAISGNDLSRVFDINPNDVVPGNNVVLGAVTINGVTIENGVAQAGDGATGSGGGIRDQGPVDLILNNDVITNNSATADGGGISMENAASTKWALMLNNTTVSNNHAGDAGGGVEEDGTGLVNITNSTIADNTCLNQGAGVWLDAINGGTATLNVTGSVIRGNTAGMLAGGIGQAGSSTVTISNSTVEENTSTGFGGGFGDQNNLGTLVVQNSLFLNNKAGTNGGGIQEGGVSTTITGSEIKGNAAGINGAMPIGSSGGKPNAVLGSGGGLFINGGSLALTASTVADNTATLDGGGIELQTTAGATITNTTIAGNTALNNAGGNGVANDGGGIDDKAAVAALALVDDTLTNNFAANGGGLFFAGNTGPLTVQNTILAQNLASTAGPDVAFIGTPAGVDQGGNLIGIGNPTFFTAGTTQQGTAANPLNPLLGPLANNGGTPAGATGTQMTVETEAVLPGSPAMGKGVANGVGTDERGAPRLTTPDVGAFQFENTTLSVTISAAPTVGLNATEPVKVTVTNTGANPLPADNTLLTVAASGGLSGAPQTSPVGPLAAGQSATFTFTATGATLGTGTVTATVVSPDTNPATVTASATVTVATGGGNIPIGTRPGANTTTAPVGTLTPFAFGFGPTGLDIFEADSVGDVFAAAFHPGAPPGAPVFLTNALQFASPQVSDGALLAFLQDGNQRFLVDVFNVFNPAVEPAVLAALHL